MFKDEYYVIKDSGTYANTLEAFGLITIFNFITGGQYNSIKFIDNKTHYIIKLSRTINESIISNIKYKEFIPYIKYKDVPPVGSDFIDYEEQKKISDNQKKFEKKKYEEIAKTNDIRLKKNLKRDIQDFQPKRHFYWDLISNFNKLKALSAYKKIFLNVKKNQDEFSEIIKTILLLYSDLADNVTTAEIVLKNLEKEKRLKKLDKVNALQIFNPHQGKGVNAMKANSISLGGEKAFWLREYLKIIGSYKSMIIRSIKVSSKTWDTKIYVIEPKKIDFEFIDRVFREFRPVLKGVSSLKLDIASILKFCQIFIENIDEYKQEKPFLKFYNPHHSVNGFYTAYLKKLGTSESVTNLSFLQLPFFIDIHTKEEAKEWIRILKDHYTILTGNSIIESGIGLEILQLYRQFITTSKIELFILMLCTYSEYLIQEISKGHYYVYPFSKELLEKFFQLTKEHFMVAENKAIAPVFQVEGFKNIAKAIRNSTISLQYTPKTMRLYEVKYGLAQSLKRKSAYKNELIEFICDFSSSFNSENARIKERKGESFITRTNIKQQDIEEVISLIDEYGANIIGKLLAAYGYALDRKEKIEEADEVEISDNEE